MPMEKDPADGGTEQDGIKSSKYCGYCYRDGKFTRDCTAEEMQKLCLEKLKEMHFHTLFAWFLTRNIPKLERWRKN